MSVAWHCTPLSRRRIVISGPWDRQRCERPQRRAGAQLAERRRARHAGRGTARIRVHAGRREADRGHRGRAWHRGRSRNGCLESCTDAGRAGGGARGDRESLASYGIPALACATSARSRRPRRDVRSDRGRVDSLALLRAWKPALVAAGVAIHENTHVPPSRTDALRIVTDGEVRAGALVLATNAHTPSLGFFRNRSCRYRASRSRRRCSTTRPGARFGIGVRRLQRRPRPHRVRLPDGARTPRVRRRQHAAVPPTATVAHRCSRRRRRPRVRSRRCATTMALLPAAASRRARRVLDRPARPDVRPRAEHRHDRLARATSTTRSGTAGTASALGMQAGRVIADLRRRPRPWRGFRSSSGGCRSSCRSRSGGSAIMRTRLTGRSPRRWTARRQQRPAPASTHCAMICVEHREF